MDLSRLSMASGFSAFHFTHDSLVMDELMTIALQLIPHIQSDLGVGAAAAAPAAPAAPAPASPHLNLLSRVVCVAAHSHSQIIHSMPPL